MTKIKTITLTNADQVRYITLAQSLVTLPSSPDHSWHYQLDEIRKLSLSACFKPLIREIKNSIHEDVHVLRIGPFNFNSDQLEPTPSSAIPSEPGASLGLAQKILLSVASQTGDVVTYRDMKQSMSYVQHVFPIKEMANTQTAASSDENLLWHTEHAVKPDRPDYLVFFCLRNPGKIPTRYSAPQMRKLHPKHTVELRSGFVSQLNRKSSFGLLSACGHRSDEPSRLCYDPLFIFPRKQTKKKSEALAALSHLIEDSAVNAPQTPGWITILNNKTGVHARESFVSKFNGSDRWLLRSFVRV